jgi:hypothetical protein
VNPTCTYKDRDIRVAAVCYRSRCTFNVPLPTSFSTMFFILPTTLRLLLATLIWNKDLPGLDATQLTFQLRHQLAVSNGSRLALSNAAPSFSAQTYSVHTRPLEVYRPSSYSAFSRARLRSLRYKQSEQFLWEGVEMQGPLVSSRQSLLALAKMTFNSYYEAGHQQWYDLGAGWNVVCPYPTEHVFNKLMNSQELPIWMGTGCRWSSWTCLCV